MAGFTFDSTKSSDVGIVCRSVDRTLLPKKRIKQYIIPGKSGTYDVENGYENRLIVCEIGFTGTNYTREELRIKARKVAQWLSGAGLLIFDDEPDKGYQAKVIDGISIEEIAATGKAQVTFECGPFAEGLTYALAATGEVSLPATTDIVVSGTQSTNALIHIKASGTVSGLKISRLTTY